jgi:hypothetical protein
MMGHLLGRRDSSAMHRSVMEYSLLVVPAPVDPTGSWAEGPGLMTATVGQIAKFWVQLFITSLAILMPLHHG